MIHEAYMPVYMGSRFLARDGRTDGRMDRGSTRGPRGPKKGSNIGPFSFHCVFMVDRYTPCYAI